MNLRRGTVWGVLLAQLWATGLSGFAHAREAFDAPVRIESTQHQRCVVLHDASTCALCSHSQTQAIVAARAVAINPAPHPRATVPPVVIVHAPAPPAHSTAPRGPPLVVV
jgi:hypothetical protein